MVTADASNYRMANVSFLCHPEGILHRHDRSLSLYPPIPYSQPSDHSVTDGLTNTMLLIGTPLVVTCWRSIIHSWRYIQCHSWSCCGPNSPPIFSKCCSRFKKCRSGGMTCAELLSFPIKYSSVSILILLKLMSLLYQWSRLIFSLLVGIPSESECLCLTLGMFCYWIVVPPPPVYLKRVDHLISVVPMDVVAVRVYGLPIDPHFLRDLSNVCH